MKGDDRARFCDRCALTVYNLSGMTRDEATALVSQRGGRTCVRFYRRGDGTVLTRDCEGGLTRLLRAQLTRRSQHRLTASTLVIMTVLTAALAFVELFQDNLRSLMFNDVGGALAGDTQVERRTSKNREFGRLPPNFQERSDY